MAAISELISFSDFGGGGGGGAALESSLREQ
jgi:hypothetical protein